MKGLLKILGTAIIGGLVVIGGQYLFTNKDKKIEEPITFQQDNSPIEAKAVRNYTEETESNLPDLKEAASKTVHAVVYIQTEFTRKSSVYDQYFSIDDFFGRRSPSVLKASGSGVIISSDGYIVTNNHVVQEADKITITLNDKRTYNAKVIGTNPETDLALLKIDEKNLEYVKFGNSDQLQVGDWVLAVGNPFNLTSTVTAGIISAKARNINILGSNSAIESFLQTDAVVNPGNSGGALVDTKGRLVGINAAIASRTGSYIGYSFAIPVSIVKKVVTDLKEFGSVQRAYIGITIKEVNAELAKKLKLDSIKGVYIGSVLEKGAAYNAGLEAGNVILSFNNTPVNSTSFLLEKIGLQRPGDKVKLKVIQDNKIRNIDVVLTNKYGTPELEKPSEIEVASKIGAEFSNVSKSLMQDLGINHGLQINKLQNGVFKTAGIRNGFIILKIGNTEINTKKDITNALADKKGGILIEGIYPNGVRAYYGIGL
jgi:Do/DeqQ family serine protease